MGALEVMTFTCCADVEPLKAQVEPLLQKAKDAVDPLIAKAKENVEPLWEQAKPHVDHVWDKVHPLTGLFLPILHIPVSAVISWR